MEAKSSKRGALFSLYIRMAMQLPRAPPVLKKHRFSKALSLLSSHCVFCYTGRQTDLALTEVTVSPAATFSLT